MLVASHWKSELQAESRLLLSKLKNLIRDQTTIQVDVGETIQVTSGLGWARNIEHLRSSEVYGDDWWWLIMYIYI